MTAPDPCTDRLDLLAVAIDARLGVVPAQRVPGRIFGVFADATRADGFRLELLASGDAREIVQRVRVPPAAIAIAHSAAGWSAPMPDDGDAFVRPSLHPQRRRAHTVTLVGDDGVVWSVVRIGDDAPHVWPDGVGVIPDGLRRAWLDARTRTRAFRR